jgi:uncharacterized protein (TIGR02145 family)
VVVRVPYTAGNGGVYTGQTVVSAGATGLTAVLESGNLAEGSGSLTYQIGGTAEAVGTAIFTLNIGGKTCALEVPVQAPQAKISVLDCSGITFSGNLTEGAEATGASFTVPYSGGNGGVYAGQVVASAGIGGLTATLDAGTLAIGSGSLVFKIGGVPSGLGSGSFVVAFGGFTCTVSFEVLGKCRAYVSATTQKPFLCYNLGAANTQADPFTPSWEINGGYWQWGRKEESAAGPTGANEEQANADGIAGWNEEMAPNMSWVDASKTSLDPCPAGYRVPTLADWKGVLAHNPRAIMGSWAGGTSNYDSGLKIGDHLYLPANGDRSPDEGALAGRGTLGYYWSSKENGSQFAWLLFITQDNASTTTFFRSSGFAVRCVGE